jgi:hypothetical protein
MPWLEPLPQLPGTSVIIYCKLDRTKPCLIVWDAKAQSTISSCLRESIMDAETIEFPITPKKPYARPQLHDLNGSEADGKVTTFRAESGRSFGPS